MEVLQAKFSYQQRPGCCNYPTSHQCTEPSEQSPGIPTPPGRSPQSHPGMSTDPKTKQQKIASQAGTDGSVGKTLTTQPDAQSLILEPT